MLFGHNPELTELATCAVADFTFDAKSWSKIGKVKPARVAFDYPKRS
jgi:phosphohistidine phosphatase